MGNLPHHPKFEAPLRSCPLLSGMLSASLSGCPGSLRLSPSGLLPLALREMFMVKGQCELSIHLASFSQFLGFFWLKGNTSPKSWPCRGCQLLVPHGCEALPSPQGSDWDISALEPPPQEALSGPSPPLFPPWETL